jgi:radical SAM protein with 4Fe4S-binding SPASM domain
MSKKVDLNKTLGFSDEEVRRCRAQNGLLSMELEFTRGCNLKCVYCYSQAGVSAENELTMDELMSAVDQAKDLGAKKIILLGGGEPLVFKGLENIITYISSLGLEQILFTNGTLIDEAVADMLAKNRVFVIVKRNSLKPDVQDALAGVNGAFGRIEKGLAALSRAGYPGDGLSLGIQTVICRQNLDEIPSLWTWARERNIVPYVEILTMQGRARENGMIAVPPSGTRQLFERLEEIDRSSFGILWRSRPTIAAFSCRRHLYSCLVNAQGYVQPCTGVDLFVGNIRERPLREILRTSSVIGKLRNIYEHLEGECRKCRHSGECYGCRGNAYQLTGNYLASDPTCWICNKVKNEDPVYLCKQ